jgi:glucose/arabinose dehydrogenase
MALDPGLLKGTGNDYVYVAYTYDADADPARVSGRTKIVRFAYDPRTHALGSAKDVLTGLPAGTDHQGGRLVIGPDRKLYFTIGDLGANQLANFCNPNRAQMLPTVAQVDKRDWSLYEGKILRLNLDGSIPADNPTLGGVRSHIFSYGHRNPQGLVFAPDGKLYDSEHGPNTDDEVNLIRAGANYGWPHVAGYRDDQCTPTRTGRRRRACRARRDVYGLSRGATVGSRAEGERVEPRVRSAHPDVSYGADRIRLQEPQMRGTRAVLPVLADGRAVEPRGLHREERHPRLGSLAADAEPQARHGLPHAA